MSSKVAQQIRVCSGTQLQRAVLLLCANMILEETRHSKRMNWDGVSLSRRQFSTMGKSNLRQRIVNRDLWKSLRLVLCGLYCCWSSHSKLVRVGWRKFASSRTCVTCPNETSLFRKLDNNKYHNPIVWNKSTQTKADKDWLDKTTRYAEIQKIDRKKNSPVLCVYITLVY